MPTRNINLTEHFDAFVDEQIEAGRFRNASEVLRAGLHLLELETAREQAKLTALRALTREGLRDLDQGGGIRLENDQQLSAFLTGIRKQVQKKSGKRRNGT